jgi:hypothetical protein
MDKHYLRDLADHGPTVWLAPEKRAFLAPFTELTGFCVLLLLRRLPTTSPFPLTTTPVCGIIDPHLDNLHPHNGGPPLMLARIQAMWRLLTRTGSAVDLTIRVNDTAGGVDTEAALLRWHRENRIPVDELIAGIFRAQKQA